jgi:hypothetical protein
MMWKWVFWVLLPQCLTMDSVEVSNFKCQCALNKKNSPRKSLLPLETAQKRRTGARKWTFRQYWLLKLHPERQGGWVAVLTSIFNRITKYPPPYWEVSQENWDFHSCWSNLPLSCAWWCQWRSHGKPALRSPLVDSELPLHLLAGWCWRKLRWKSGLHHWGATKYDQKSLVGRSHPCPVVQL